MLVSTLPLESLQLRGWGSWVLQKGKGASDQPGLSLEAGMLWGEAGELGWEQC